MHTEDFPHPRTTWPLAVIAAFSMGLAWWWPGTALCASLGWISVTSLVLLLLRSPKPYRHAYLCGLVVHPLGFYWLLPTIKDFGGFPFLPAFSIFSLFVLYGALQFTAFVFVYRHLPVALDKFGIRAAWAWVVIEYLPLRVFPWYAGHTQLAFQPLAQIADLAGVLTISFLMFWMAEASARLILLRQRNTGLFTAPLVLLLALGYGEIRISRFSHFAGPKFKVALVQANISVAEKHNVKYFQSNTDRYISLTAKVAGPDRLIIWPESVIQEFVPVDVGAAENFPALKAPGLFHTPMLIGSLTADYASRDYFNSALALYADGKVPRPYHKQVLMPFGEYMPLAGAFPWLKNIFETPDFRAGDGPRVFDYQMVSDKNEPGHILAAPLICYEDVIESPSRESARQGATLLVNLTNDAWYGNTIAPLQHHLIASFRAIENRRFLLRSTNSGLTAIVDPVGRTVSSLPVFSDGILTGQVYPVRNMSIYTQYLASFPWLVLLVFSVPLVVFGRKCRRFK